MDGLRNPRENPHRHVTKTIIQEGALCRFIRKTLTLSLELGQEELPRFSSLTVDRLHEFEALPYRLTERLT